MRCFCSAWGVFYGLKAAFARKSRFFVPETSNKIPQSGNLLWDNVGLCVGYFL